MTNKKVSVGAIPLLYPEPAVLVGVNVNGKPNFTTVAWAGVVASEPPTLMVALRPSRYSTKGLFEQRVFSVNIPSAQMAEEVDVINQTLKKQSRSYVLIGPGRWGSSDKFLGVPVKWGQISEASVIVECGLENFRVDPSQGTHFFQNLISFEVGYLTINPFLNDGGLDTAILAAAEAVSETKYIRHVRFPEPLYIFVDGRNNKAIIKAR